MDGQSDDLTFVDIPLVDLGAAGPSALIEAERARFDDLFRSGLAHYGRSTLKIGDALTRRWLADCPTPYRADLDACAGQLDHAGAYMLNLSYEWSCTTSVGPPPSGQGNRLLRTLDWPLAGLGRNVVVARNEAAAGEWFNVTWPGFVGVVTAMAPGRFSAAINQPPMPRYTPNCWIDWGIERLGIWRRRLMPPAHLLRQTFETCRTYDEAKAMLSETPIAVPAFFSLSGMDGNQGCVIERTADRAYISDGGTASVANHWVAAPMVGRMRGMNSPGRFQQMKDCAVGIEGGFDWVSPPILNPTTRLAVTANARMRLLEVRGYETSGPVTHDFSLRN